MSTNFLKRTKLTPCTGKVTSTAAASSNFGTQVDMQGFDGCCFTAVFNCTAASTGTAVFKIVGTDTSTAASTDYTSISTAYAQVSVVSSTAKSAAAATQRYARIDLFRPRYRYLKTKVVRTAKIGIGAIIAEQYDPRKEPTTNSTTASVLATTAYATSNLFYVKETT